MDSYHVTLDDKLRVTSYNKAFIEDILPERCALGYNILSVFDSSDREAIHGIFDCCKTDASEYTLTGKKTLASSSNPKHFPVRIEIPWVISYGDDVFSMTSCRLDEERKKLEADELKDFLNMAPIALHWLSDEGRVLWVNDRELNVLGYSREEYIGEDIMKFCPDSRDDVLAIFHQLGSGNSIRDVPVRFRTKDGRIKDLLIDSNVNYKEDGSFNHTRCFIRDDTGRKIREAREETRKALSDKLVLEKENFIGKVIHHLKTPLHIMRMDLGMGCENDVLDTHLQGMGKMLSNLSDAVRFDKGYIKPLDLVDCDLSVFMKGFRVRNTNSSIEFDYSGLSNTKVRVDTNILSTIIEEIILFCDEYSSDGTVTLEAKNSPGSNIYLFRVFYGGEKLNEVDVHRLFHNYWTSDSFGTQDESPILGVGLNIAFNYIQCLNSELCFESDEESTSFMFDLCLASIPLVSERRLSKSVDWDLIGSSDDIITVTPIPLGLNDPKVRHILLVEDNTICQKLCKRVINKLGHTCDLADNGSIAVDLVCSGDYIVYDLVLMDIRMPIMDGIEATRIISEYCKSKCVELPIVAVSAEESICDGMGFTSFLKKPTLPSDIERVINAHT